MSIEELYADTKKRIPVYRRILASFTSLLKSMGKNIKSRFKATASDDVFDLTSAPADSGGSDGGSLQVDSIKVPSSKKLKELIDGLDIETIDELDYRIDRLSNSSVKEHQKLADQLLVIRDAMVDKYTEALDAMESITEEHMPDSVSAIFEGVQKFFDKQDPDVAYYLSVDAKKNDIQFVLNADVTHWENVNQEQRVCVVVTCELKRNGDVYELRTYVAVHDKIGLPFKQRIGKEVAGGSDTRAVIKAFPAMAKREMSAFGISSFVQPVNIPVDETEIVDLLEQIEGVADVSITETSITITTEEQDNDVLRQVLGVIQSRPKIKKMLRQGYHGSLAEVEPLEYVYTMTQRK